MHKQMLGISSKEMLLLPKKPKTQNKKKTPPTQKSPTTLSFPCNNTPELFQKNTSKRYVRKPN